MNKIKHLTNYERETIINYNQDEKKASIYTYDPKLVRQLDKLSKKFPDLFKLIKADDWGTRFYECPKKFINVRMPKILTEAQKMVAIENIRKVRETKNMYVDTEG